MARKDVDLVIRAKDEAEKVIQSITQALQEFKSAQTEATEVSGKTQTALGGLGTAVGKLDKAFKGSSIGEALSKGLSSAQEASERLDKSLVASKEGAAKYTEELAKATEQTVKLEAAQKKATTEANAAKVALSEQTKALAADTTAKDKAIARQKELADSIPKLTQKIADQTVKVAAAKAKQAELALEIDKADKPTKRLTISYEAAQRRVLSTTESLTALQTKLTATNVEMDASGTTTARLTTAIEKGTIAVKDKAAAVSAADKTLKLATEEERAAIKSQNDLAVAADRAAIAVTRETENVAKAEEELSKLTQASIRASEAQAALKASRSGGLQTSVIDQGVSTQDAKAQFQQLSQVASTLAEDIGKVGVPTREMSRDLQLAKQAADEAELKFELMKETTLLMGSAFAKSGQDVASLQATEAKLSAQQAVLARSLQMVSEDGFKARQAIRALHDEEGRAIPKPQPIVTPAELTLTERLAQAYRNLYGEQRQSLSLTQRVRGEVLSLVAAYGGLYGIVDLLGKVVAATQQLEAGTSRLNVAFSGDKTKVATELDFIRREAERLGVSFGDLADEYSKFAIATQGTNLAGANTRKIFLAVAEAARVNRSSTEDVQGVFLALTQIVSKGSVQMEELRQQLGDRLPGALNLMSSALGLTNGQLIKLTSEGKISADALVPFADKLNERFGPELAAALTSTTVELGRLKNAGFEALLAFGNAGFVEGFTKMVRQLTEVLKSADFIHFISEMSVVFGKLAELVGFLGQNFDVLVTALGAFVGVKIIPFVLAIGAGFVNLRKEFVLVQAGMKTTAAVSAAMGVEMGAAGVAAEGLSVAFRLLLSSTGIGLAIVAVTTALAYFATQATVTEDVLAAHRKTVDEVKNAYDAAGGSVKDWNAALKDLTSTQLVKQMQDVKKAAEEARLSIAQTFQSQTGGKAGAISKPYGTATQEVRDLVSVFKAGGVSVKLFKDSLESIAAAHPDINKEKLLELENIADAAKPATTALDELVAVMVLLNPTSTELAKNAALVALGLRQAGDAGAEAAAKANEKLTAYDKAMQDLQGHIDKASGALGELKAKADIEAAFKSAVNAAISMGQVAAAIERANAALDELNQKDIGAKFGNFTNGGDASAALLRQRESFRSRAYNDPRTDTNGQQVGPDIYRAGYGSDTITLSDGTIQKVTQGMRVSVEDANRDLIRRIGVFQEGIKTSIGADKFGSMTPEQQAALTSIAYNYGSLPNDIADAIKKGMTDSQVADVIRGHSGDNGGVNRDRRGYEAALYNSADNPAIVEKTLQHITTEEEKQAAAAARAKETADQYNADLAERLQEGQAELANQGKLTRGAAIQKALYDEIKKAKAAGVTLTQDELDKVSELAGKLFDQSDTQTAANKKIAEANALWTQRVALEAALKDARSKGDDAGVASLASQIEAVNTQLQDAINKAEEMWKAIGGPDADAAIAKLEALKVKSAQTSNKMNIDFTRVKDLIVDGLAGAFDSFAKDIADGVKPVIALKNAFLKFASDFLLQIAQMIIKQALLNALQKAFGGTGFGKLIGLAHTGGVVGSGGRVGSGNGTRMVNPAMFAAAPRYHSGGIAGLAPNEVPAVLQQGEEVLTKNDPRHILNGGAVPASAGGGMNVRILNLLDAASFVSAALANGGADKDILNWMKGNAAAVKQAMA